MSQRLGPNVKLGLNTRPTVPRQQHLVIEGLSIVLRRSMITSSAIERQSERAGLLTEFHNDKNVCQWLIDRPLRCLLLIVARHKVSGPHISRNCYVDIQTAWMYGFQQFLFERRVAVRLFTASTFSHPSNQPAGQYALKCTLYIDR